jgi:hypothetical protein
LRAFKPLRSEFSNWSTKVYEYGVRGQEELHYKYTSLGDECGLEE